MREIWFHAHISHPSIVPMYAAWLESDRICIAVEYAHDGSVFRSLRRHSRTLEAVEAGQRIMQPVLSALLFMHELGLVHRDIKCVSSLLPDRGCCFSAGPVTITSGPCDAQLTSCARVAQGQAPLADGGAHMHSSPYRFTASESACSAT